MTRIRILAALLLVGAIGIPVQNAHAQLGALKKKLKEASGKQTEEQGADHPVVFDAVTLEITPERIEKLTAAKQASRKFALGPEGPAAIERQIEALDARQAAIYDKQVNNINAFDQKRRDYENCVDSILADITNKKNAQMGSQMLSDPAGMRKMMELSQAMLAAQTKGDTATVRKIGEEVSRMKAPSSADSADAGRRCGNPTPPPLVKEWLGLKQQIDSMGKKKQEAESQLASTEESASGMNPRQNAMFCERIKMYVQQLKEKKKHVGFSDDELKRLANLEQAIKDLEALCP